MNSSRSLVSHARRRSAFPAAALLAAAFVVGAAGTAGAQDQASGTFTVKGAATRFAFAYTFWKANVFTGKPDLYVLFSDVAIPPDTIPKNDDGVGKMAALVRENKVHAVELHLAPQYRKLDNASDLAVYHVGLSPARFGMGGITTYEATTVTDTTLEGRARTDGPQNHDGVAWQFDVQFKVAIPPPAKGT